MAELKTKLTTENVEDFLNRIEDPQRRADCFALLELMKNASGHEPAMSGSAIVGFGQYTYHYASGRSGDWMVSGFSPRKGDLTIYVSSYLENFADILARLGKFKTGKGCLYIKHLSNVDLEVLAELIRAAHRMVESQPAGA
jgi:hypothetical protein